ncbi:hypothetical protein [Mucilaginibacter agri]|uniref:Uncharacterized protein n=1 Tax=Mucilaginibacter agri TaxID=2695265 RepID=A0A965ZI63_9SPHI|nr:hypothetical protein [Mucilaginibacter agri]NCD70141.1 hypothetical protein [Mucilaginibacter agri]
MEKVDYQPFAEITKCFPLCEKNSQIFSSWITICLKNAKILIKNADKNAWILKGILRENRLWKKFLFEISK